MKVSELKERLLDIVNNHKTLYVMGCFGAPLTGANVARYQNNHSYNKAATRIAMIKVAADKNPPVFGFDCVNLIKGIGWGWTGDSSKTYGGATYATNGIPDTNADGMIGQCKEVSTDFSKLKIGSAVWLSGHIGVYIGDGLVVESSPAFENGVQITVCTNVSNRTDFSGRKWTKHGVMPYFEYDVESGSNTNQPETTVTSAEISVGDTVEFLGDTHYVNANASEGKSCKAGTAKVTAISTGGEHPYHIIGDKNPSNVYGWVDVNMVRKI